MVEFSPVELAWLEILVGFYPVDGLAQFVEITNGVAVAIGIKKSLHRLSHNSEFFDRQLILVAVQTLQIIPGYSAVFRRGNSAFAQSTLENPNLTKGKSPLQSKVQYPNRRAVAFLTKNLDLTA